MSDVRSEEVTQGGTPRAGAGWGWILAYGVVSAVLGVIAFLSPFAATVAATVAVGAYLTAVGVMALIASLTARGHEHRGYRLALGIFSILAGLLTAFRPFSGALSITVLIAVWLFLRGVAEIAWGSRHARHRAGMIALGVLNLLLAVFILATVPLSALTLPGYVLGLSLVFGGAMAIASALAHRKSAPAFSLPD